MPCSLRKLPEAFGLNATKSWYSHYFNTKENMNSVGEIPDVSYYGADTMSAKKRQSFSHCTRVRGLRSLIKGALKRLTAKMTSLCLDKRAPYSDESLWR